MTTPPCHHIIYSVLHLCRGDETALNLRRLEHTPLLQSCSLHHWLSHSPQSRYCQLPKILKQLTSLKKCPPRQGLHSPLATTPRPRSLFVAKLFNNIVAVFTYLFHSLSSTHNNQDFVFPIQRSCSYQCQQPPSFCRIQGSLLSAHLTHRLSSMWHNYSHLPSGVTLLPGFGVTVLCWFSSNLRAAAQC